MHGFLLQDWVSVSGTSSTQTVVQSDAQMLDLAAYQDFVAWVEVEAFVSGGSASPTLWLETAPAKDAALFTPVGLVQTSVAIQVGITTTKNVLNAPKANQIPLARWLRWRLDMSGASANWYVNFRIHVAAHAVSV